MINIMELNNTEMKSLCNLIGYKAIRKHFQSNPGAFSQIKPGFRAASLKTSEISSLVSRNREKPFILDFLCNALNKMHAEIQDAKNAVGQEGSSESRLAAALFQSSFAEEIGLYFRLFQDEYEDVRIDRIMEEIEKLRNSQSVEEKSADEAQNGFIDVECDELAVDVEMPDPAKSVVSKLQVLTENEHLRAIEELTAKHDEEMKEQSRRYETSLAEKDAELEKVKSALQDVQNELHRLSQYDDSCEVAASEYQHISLCEVVYPNPDRRPWLCRLADIGPNGEMARFIAQDGIPRYFSNRDKLYYREGPNEAGRVGIWSWSSVENRDDPSKDYVLSRYEAQYSPIEVVLLRDCSSIDDVVVRIKADEIQLPAADTFVIAAHLQGAQYIGVKCTRTQFDWSSSGGRIKRDVIAIPVYQFTQSDTLRLGNDRLYFGKLSLGIPCDIRRIKEPLEIVRELVLNENTWPVFKQRGIAKGKWQSFRSFLNQIETDDLIEKIASACGCGKGEAGQYLADFLNRAAEYIDGRSIEEEILSVAIQSDAALMQRCKALILADWEAENKALMDSAEAERSAITQRALDAKCEVEQLQADYGRLAQKRAQLVEEIAQREQFAADVEEKVSETIRRAQDNAATFIANMAFLPRKKNVIQTEAASAEMAHYIQGDAIDAEEIEINRDWKDVLDSIESELMNAGVVEKYARAFGAFLYSCFLNRAPVLLCGPNAGEIADAFSAALYGETAGTLELAGSYDSSILAKCANHIIKVKNIFAHGWTSRLPDILGRDENYFLAVYPYAEDVAIEPKSLFSHIMPVLTELLVDRVAEPPIMGGRIAEHFTAYVPGTVRRMHWARALRATLFFRNRAQAILGTMHDMLNDGSSDWDMLFMGIPYAFVTMQMPALLEELRDAENRKIQVSKDLLDMLEGTYGE